jgi:hypothetical protein
MLTSTRPGGDHQARGSLLRFDKYARDDRQEVAD